MPSSRRDGLTGQFDLVAALDAEGRQQLAAVAHTVEVEAATVLQTVGGPATRLLLVTAGSLHVVRSDRAGRRRIVRIIGPGDHYGLVELALDSAARYLVEAGEDSTLTEIRFDDLRTIADRHPALQRAITMALARKTAESEHLLVSLTSEDVATRVVSYLLSLPRRRGGDGRTSVQLPLTQIDLASYLGTTPETLSRRLRELMDSGAISRGAHREFTLDEELLARY